MVVTRLQTKRSCGIAPRDPNYSEYRLRKRARRPKKHPGAQGFKLLELPWEIRQIILRDLLWQPNPICFYSTDDPFTGQAAMRTIDDPAFEDYWVNLRTNSGRNARQFYPEILAVCKQLYAEGSPILYDNSVKCTVDPLGYGTYSVDTTILGRRYEPRHWGSGDLDENGDEISDEDEEGPKVPPMVLKGMKRAHVVVFSCSNFSDNDGLDDDESYAFLQDALCDCVEILKTSNWKYLTLELRIQTFYDDEEEDPRLRDDLFRQFLPLRDCKEVSIIGVSNSLSAELKRVTMSSSLAYPSMDLLAAYLALQRYVWSLTTCNGYHSFGFYDERVLTDHINNQLNAIAEQVQAVKQEEFLQMRRRLLQDCSELMLFRQTKVFSKDPENMPYQPRGTILTLDEGDRVFKINRLETPNNLAVVPVDS